jgi:CelD/BcsL family acetyltransferase involved in cellulose biosynthesis
LTRQTVERGFRVFDFTIGDEPYQRDWCETELTLFDHISVATLRGALVAVPLLARRRSSAGSNRRRYCGTYSAGHARLSDRWRYACIANVPDAAAR